MEPINVSNTTLSLKAGRGHRKFDAKQAERHDFGEAHCVICDEVFTKYYTRTIVCSEECRRKRHNARQRKYQRNNREKVLVLRRKQYLSNPEKWKRRREENHERINANQRKRRRAKKNEG